MIMEDVPRHLFDRLLAEAKALYDGAPALQDFADWPSDLAYIPPRPAAVPMLPQIRAMKGQGPFHAALGAICPHADWVQTYNEAEVGRHFLDNYGYVELFGPSGIYITQQCRAFIGYWGEGLVYPLHDHEAEEIYLVVSGSCRFEADGDAAADLGPGGTKFHRSFQPHAMRMGPAGMLAFCLWRGAGLADMASITERPADN